MNLHIVETVPLTGNAPEAEPREEEDEQKILIVINFSSIPCETAKIAEQIGVFWPAVLGLPSTGRRNKLLYSIRSQGVKGLSREDTHTNGGQIN